MDIPIKFWLAYDKYRSVNPFNKRALQKAGLGFAPLFDLRSFMRRR